MNKLTFQLLRLFAEGVLPATLVQILALASRQDFAAGNGDDPLLEQLASLGSEGRHTSSILRDLLRLSKRVGMMDTTPEPYFVQVKGPKNSQRSINVVLPHEQVQLVAEKDGADVYRVSDTKWNSDIGVGRLLREWGQRVGLEPELTRETLVLGLHADGVSYTTSQRVGYNRSVNVASWNVISAHLPKHRGRRHLYFAISKASVCDCGCEGESIG